MSFNTITIHGNLTANPNVRATSDGKEIAYFDIATNKRKSDGSDKATFFTCRAFGRTASLIQKYFTKGSPIIVIGEMEQENYTSKDGQARSKLYVLVWRINFIGNKQDSNSNYTNATEYVAEASDGVDDDVPF